MVLKNVFDKVLIEFLRCVSYILFTVFYRVKVHGIHNFPKEGPVLVCANHQSFIDVFMIGYKLDRLVNYMAKSELFGVPIISYVIKICGAYPVKRGFGDVGAIKSTMKQLKEGKAVGMFPEGTRNKKKNDEKIKPGAAMIAIKAKVPIIPVKIDGKIRIFRKIDVYFGQPYKIESVDNKKYSSLELTEFSKDIMKRINKLPEDVQQWK